MDTPVLIAIAVLAAACALLLVGLVFVSMRQRALHRELDLLQGESTEHDFVAIVGEHVTATRDLERRTRQVEGRLQDVRRTLARSIQRVGVVRYDAFDDMGGHLSFSAAFLDEHGTGVALTCINGRNDARIYAKGVLKTGDAGVGLSAEEVAAVSLAMEGDDEASGPEPQ